MSKSAPTAKEVDQISANEKTTNKPSSASLDQALLPPTIGELAMLAATLKRNGENNLARLAKEALDLWEACVQEVQQRRESRRRHLDELCADISTPEIYPISFARFLELMLPQRRGADRERAYRHFLMDWKSIDIGAAGDLLAEQKNKSIEHWDFCQLGPLFHEWLKIDLKWKKRMNGLRGRKGISQDQILVEEKKGAQERFNVVATAAEKWDAAARKFVRGFIL